MDTIPCKICGESTPACDTTHGERVLCSVCYDEKYNACRTELYGTPAEQDRKAAQRKETGS